MGTLTGSAISSTYESLIFTDKTSSGVGDIYYTNGSSDVKLTTLTTALTFTGKITATAGIQLTNNEIYASDGGTAITLDTSDNVTIGNYLKVTGNIIQASDGGNTITMDTSDNVTIAGDLTVTGNDIKSSTGATAITFSGANSTLAGDLTVSGGDITATGAESGAASLLLSADQSDDAGDDWKLISNADNTFTIGNDINSAGTDVPHLTITPNSSVASSVFDIKGLLKVSGNGIQNSAGASVMAWSGTTLSPAGSMSMAAGDIDFAANREISFASGNFAINDASNDALLFTKNGSTVYDNTMDVKYRLVVSGGITQAVKAFSSDANGDLEPEDSGKYVLISNAMAGNRTITLPAASESSGVNYKFKVTVDLSGTLNIQSPTAGELMIGGVTHVDTDTDVTTQTMDTQVLAAAADEGIQLKADTKAGTWLEMVSDGAEWYLSGVVFADTAPTYVDA